MHERAARETEIVNVRDNSRHTYYTLNVVGRGVEPIRIVQNHKHKRFACMTCHRTSPDCAYARFVAERAAPYDRERFNQ